MKKLIISMLTVLCCTGIFAADFFAWKMTDANKAQHEKCLANPKYSRWRKVCLSVNKKLYENPNAFKTYDDLKKFLEEKSVEYKTGVNVSQQVYCRPVALKHLYNDAFDDAIATNDVFVYHFLKGDRSISILNLKKSEIEIWRILSKAMINRTWGETTKHAVKLMISYDLNVPKEEKIEVYSKLYEKWYIQLIGKQKDYFTMPVTMIAMKLKSLGYDVNKPNI